LRREIITVARAGASTLVAAVPSRLLPPLGRTLMDTDPAADGIFAALLGARCLFHVTMMPGREAHGKSGRRCLV